MELDIKTPRWALPLLEPKRYKGVKGGRGSGKSHTLAENAVERMVMNPNTSIVCIREIQKSLKFSAKKVIEDKIRSMGVSHLFDITLNEIRAVNGSGIMIFQGMQDHTADSIKSLEGFDIAWVEEAHSLSKKSLRLLRPTIRAQDSELWFSWNPNMPTDAVDDFFEGNPPNSVLIHVNIFDNPFAPQTLIDEMEADRARLDPEDFAHIWLGEYNLQSDTLAFPPSKLNRFKMDDLNLDNVSTKIGFIDVANQGEDKLCFPIGYVIGEYCYIVDVLFSGEGMEYTVPASAQKIKQHKMNSVIVETNSFGISFYNDLNSMVSIDVQGIYETGNKHQRIIGERYNVMKYLVFRNDYEQGSEYDLYMKEIMQYTKSGKTESGKPIKHDDAPDATTGLSIFRREMLEG
ncbi:PBSX family phage terminase large subunit [Nonlabens sp. YIK11]|uniref:PBSX family phage terminase large subunit n=1 Tax=Nonlabens sp. YIK11 TaxID=1453349 RepID=UPI0009E7EE0C|nr:PBSX family phage terminase large subunit [Nonlabens sp. YIK11]